MFDYTVVRLVKGNYFRVLAIISALFVNNDNKSNKY